LEVTLNYEASLFNKIKELKGKKYGDFTIKCLLDSLPYELVFLTSDCDIDMRIISLFAKWRKQHEMWFPAQFHVTIEGTAKWFQNALINVPDRLLFMIRVKEDYIGHVGLFRYNSATRTCEIDNIVRGNPAYPGIMADAIMNMMGWGRIYLGLQGYSLTTTSDNSRALKLYKQLGFVEIKRTPLIRNVTDERTDWVEAPKNYNGEIERYSVEMSLSEGDRK
jgi:RimJ/RimL family protein N-acetyltransferase